MELKNIQIIHLSRYSKDEIEKLTSKKNAKFDFKLITGTNRLFLIGEEGN